MDYKRFDNTIIARLDKGEDILDQLEIISHKEQIHLASISALGAIDRFTVGVFDTTSKQYHANSFEGPFEIVSLTGTVSTMNDQYYAHLHLSAGDANGAVFGGHLNKANVSATCEMVIQIINGRVDRKFSEEIGLNLFSF